MQIVNALSTLGLGKPNGHVEQLHLSSRVQPLGCSTETFRAEIRGSFPHIVASSGRRDWHSKLDEVNLRLI